MNKDFRQSESFRKLISNGAEIIHLGNEETGYIMKIRYLPWIKVMFVPRVQNIQTLHFLDHYRKKQFFLFINIMPKIEIHSTEAELWYQELQKRGYRSTQLGTSPTKTVLINLQMTEEQLLKQMKYKTRYNIKLSKKRGNSTLVLNGKEIQKNKKYLDDFYTLYWQNCQRLKIKCHPKKFIEKHIDILQENLFIVFAFTKKGELGGVTFYIVTEDTVLSYLTGSTDIGRKEFIPYLLVWEGFLEGKRRGCKWFDFDGIYDERFKKAQKDWQGFTRFKLGFGGQQVTYLGSFIKWLPSLKQ